MLWRVRAPVGAEGRSRQLFLVLMAMSNQEVLTASMSNAAALATRIDLRQHTTNNTTGLCIFRDSGLFFEGISTPETLDPLLERL